MPEASKDQIWIKIIAGGRTHRFKVEVAINLEAEGVDAIIVMMIVVMMIMP